MLVCYALEDRSRWFILAFAAACALGSIYGFLQGAWPFGLVEGILVARGLAEVVAGFPGRCINQTDRVRTRLAEMLASSADAHTVKAITGHTVDFAEKSRPMM